MKFVLAVGLLVLAACSTAGATSRSKLALVSPGMSKEQVIELLGPPGGRSFRDRGEALQYCRTGFSSDEYTIIWLVDGTVRSMTTSLETIAMGNCGGKYPPIDWGQVPPDVRIAIERK
jgi:hypothetical protein